MKPTSPGLAFVMCGSFLLAMSASGQESPDAFAPGQGSTLESQVAPQPSPQVLQLVAPVALYPDALLALVLTAATYPSEVTDATRWVRLHSALDGHAREDAVNAQTWDASVKGLTQFPSVLENMSDNLSWTAALGDAYASDADVVMNAVQQLRRRAQAAGTLASTTEQTVTTNGQTIVIDPASPDVIYVPTYAPWSVYGAALPAYPAWIDAPGVVYDGPYVFYGVAMDEGGFPTHHWGYHYWNLDWHRRSVLHGERPGDDAGGYIPQQRVEQPLTTHDLAEQDVPERIREGEFHGAGLGEGERGGFGGGGFHGGGSHR